MKIQGVVAGTRVIQSGVKPLFVVRIETNDARLVDECLLIRLDYLPSLGEPVEIEINIGGR